MPTFAIIGLNQKEFSQARKDMLLTGSVSEKQWSKANSWQKGVLHQIELTIKSVSEEEFNKIHF